MTRIDGSMGEGGGQVLRTALSLSLITGRPFQIDNIRAGRQKPGLLRQHLAAVLAATEVGAAQVEGASLGSRCITFAPGRVRAGDYHFAVGSAGSGTLVFQTVLPALMMADGPSTVEIEGGTHNDAAPPFHFLARAFTPLVRRMGSDIQLTLERYGFYPAGGGRFRATIQPVQHLAPLHLEHRGETASRRVIAILANLPRRIAEREVATAASLLAWGPDAHVIESTSESGGPGNVVLVEIESTQVTGIFTAFGQKGVSAERVAQIAATEAREYLASQAAVCQHLADQLLLPMALAGAGSFTTVNVNRHAWTNMAVIQQFLPVRFETSEGRGYTKVEVATGPE
ncbi:RNA 3'-terminal phosphate cyclase [uncultured Paludibaculum sp.]|uniref:RNA 3'-terminal phosphate cyclase n=1 Tax=uncultured Paludibaculum sp. TaxID=1765020 RepID=UPI002AABFDD7|nr:RNA 3'-terminal phosphate cyclase [uncultured Paludibaculum sp.]